MSNLLLGEYKIMDRVAFDLGFIQIYWYSLFIFLGVIAGSLVIYQEAKKQSLALDDFVDLVFYTVIVAIIGARLYYVAFNLTYYLQNPVEIFEVWHGGLAIHGAILAGCLFLWFYTKKKHLNLGKLLDILVVGLILGQVIGRWGNFFNREAFGAITTKAALVRQGLPDFIIQGMYVNGAYHQPTFLYESFFNFLGFFVLIGVRRYRYLKVLQLTGVYLMWYSSIRFVVEGLRLDSLMLGPIRIAQLVSLLLFILGVYLVFIRHLKQPKLANLYAKESLYERV